MRSWVVSASPSSLFSPSSTLHLKIKTPRTSSSLSHHLKLSNLLAEFRRNGAVTHCSSRNHLAGVASPASSVRHGGVGNLTSARGTIRAHASNLSIGSPDYDGSKENGDKKITESDKPKSEKPPDLVPYVASISAVLVGCALLFLLIAFVNGGPSSLLAAIAKSGFTAAFTLIFVSEIGDKTFFIAALLAMQYEKGLVLLGSMGALSLMTVLSVIIGRVFQSVPAQFQTTLPVGEYAAVTLLMFFGLKSLKDAWDLPSKVAESSENSPELGEYMEAEELVKEKEWGDRSMLATIALGAAQSPWGVAGGAIAGHLLATLVAIIGGALLANYISEKLVGYFGGSLFLVFAGATLLGIF
ncbi:protein PAM71-homolog, chloroplastic-like isoform X2 [Papaver somniferum]|uniref:protein PAM71-homolog, chloroplastic-like isoform X2 n=1 Tax=Papaver somniferum TaxID=3469 RepID=UPI000E6F5562|nr:protein PAM71-homolog, chloroplastic-like isoform X2 [Papaver somniferum]